MVLKGSWKDQVVDRPQLGGVSLSFRDAANCAEVLRRNPHQTAASLPLTS